MNGIRSGFSVFGTVILAASASAAWASVCDSAARKASAETGVPLDVMQTITRLETGRGKTADPWPWTINHAGNGSWFQTEDEARSFVFSRIKRGESNIDIGCFQINYRWHADGFRSLDDMFNPDLNALYAARFLIDLYREFGTWAEAAGAYHSRTPKFAEKYKAKFSKIRNLLPQPDSSGPLEQIQEVASTWGRSGTARPGSLFLSESATNQPFIPFRKSD